MDYEKKYNEALERAKAQWGSVNDETRSWLEGTFPELRESEDERIRKELIEVVSDIDGGWPFEKHGVTKKEALAYLEKQKEPLGGTFSSYEMAKAFTDGQNYVMKHPERFGLHKSAVTHGEMYHVDTLGTQQVIAGKMPQPPAAEVILAKAGLKPYKDGNQWCILAGDNIQEGICGFGDTIDEALYEFLKEVLTMANSPQLKEQKQEWSEEDEKMIERLITRLNWITNNTRTDGTSPNITFFDEIDWLKSLRPQSKDEIYKEKDEAFKLGKHQLAIKFMNYLDENRPEGKMSLSNGECEDIDKAFKENDWAKIMRYVGKYSSHWKPSEEQMGALNRLMGFTLGTEDHDILLKFFNDLKTKL